MVLTMLRPLLLLALVGGIDAFAYSCEEVKYKLLSSNIAHNTTTACVFAQEGFSNWKQLNMIHFEGVSLSMQSIAAGRCVSRGQSDAPWRLTADKGLTLKCDQEFTLVFSSETPAYWTPLKQVRQAVIAEYAQQQMFVVPQTNMWLHTISCTGTGNVTFWTGAGSDENEKRFHLRSYPCSSVPKMIYSFDNVVTISTDGNVAYTAQHSSDLGSSSKPPISKLSKGDHLAVLTSGRSDDLQNLKGQGNSRAYINIGSKQDVTVDMQILLDPVNTGSVQIQKKKGFRVSDYYTGSTTETFNTDYLEVRYDPSTLKPEQIWNSRDTVLIDIFIGPKPSPAPPVPTTTTTTTTTTTVAPTAAPTTTPAAAPTPSACLSCAQGLIAITTDATSSHAFQSDVTDVSGACAVRTFTCVGLNANIEVNDGAGVIIADGHDGSVDGRATIDATCNEQGTAWVYADTVITQVECASG